MIFSMLEDKDYKAFLSKIKDETDLLIACDIENSVKNRSKDEICAFANEIGLKCVKSNLVADAIKEASDFDDSLILVAGSLYLAGNFLEENNK